MLTLWRIIKWFPDGHKEYRYFYSEDIAFSVWADHIVKYKCRANMKGLGAIQDAN